MSRCSGLRGIFLLALALAGLLSATSARAAPFCLPVPGGKPICMYDDARACEARAEQIRLSCLINTDEVTAPTVGETYCSIDSNRVQQCIYASYNSCRSAVRNDSAFCYNRLDVTQQQTEPDRNLEGASAP